MDESVSLRYSLVKEDWDSIANILLSLDTGVEGSSDTEKLRKKVGIVRHILHGYLTNFNGSEEIDLSFLVGSIKTLEKLENEFDTCGVRDREFLIFLRLLLYKLEKQKLIVRKPMERRIELGKHKGAIENANDL